MKKYSALIPVLFAAMTFVAQNDVDALRYSRLTPGGSSRFAAMGGAFGALGADLSAASYNPGGLALLRKSSIVYSAGFLSRSNTTDLYRSDYNSTSLDVNFNHFGISMTIPTDIPEDRHVLAFTSTQLQNFNNTIIMGGYTSSSSIAKDMLLLANERGSYGNLNLGYEGLAYDTYLLDYDSAGGRFFSMLDTRRAVNQLRVVQTSGVMNDRNLSYAYSYKDRFYFGASIGFPRVAYESSTQHIEADDNDSMRITMTGPDTYTNSYVDGVPAFYEDKLGFKRLEYTEYFITKGSGLNLKLGGIYRVSDMLRVGMYYHTPTRFTLEDGYYNTLRVTFDGKPNDPEELQDPEDGGYYKYVVVTPARMSLNVATLFGKSGALSLDYEAVDYSKSTISSVTASDFVGVNNVIRSKYKLSHNVRIGGEINMKPIQFRAGYAMYGSPFGHVFSGKFVRHSISAGIGFKPNDVFFADLAVIDHITSEDYYLFTAMNTRTTVKQSNLQMSITVGMKF